MIKVSTTGMMVSSKMDLRFPITGQWGHGARIIQEYGYQNAEAFYKAFHKSETAYGDYQDSLKNWKQRYGEKPQSLHDRLISKKQDIKERELTRPYSPPNRGRSR